MTANPKLLEMIAEWRRLDARGVQAERDGRHDASDQASTAATDLIHAIGDLPATSPADIMLKLDLAAEAFVGKYGRDVFTEACEPAASFLYQSLIDARRMAGGAS